MSQKIDSEKKKTIAKTKLVVVATFAILSLSLLTSMQTSRAASASSNVSYNEIYGRTGVQYLATTTPLGFSQVQYETTDGSYTGAAVNNTVALNVTSYTGTEIDGPAMTKVSFNSQYISQNGTVQASISGGDGTLLYASVEQSGESQIIWTGATEISSGTSMMINGPAYINGSQSAILTLGFAGTEDIENASSELGSTGSVTLNIPRFTFTQASTSTVKANVEVEIPARYSLLSVAGTNVNSSASLVTPIASAGASSFGNATLPDIVWRASTESSMSLGGSVVPANVSSTSSEFFGANGTTVGFVQILNLDSNYSLPVVGANTSMEIFDSSTTMLRASTDIGSIDTSRSTVEIGGQTVLLQASQSGEFVSTANIDLQHNVSLNGSSDTLVMLGTNSTNSAYFLVNGSNSVVAQVNPVTPSSETQTTITVNSASYSATLVNISASGNIIFNVSSSFPNVVVFKETSSGIVQLDSSNYWSANGRVYVFDDPSSAYYIASNVPNAESENTLASTTSVNASSSSFNLLILVGIVGIIAIAGSIVGMIARKKTKSK